MQKQRQELLNEFYEEALDNGCNELAEELIGLGANYHKKESDETIELMRAAKCGNLEKVKELSKDDVNLIDEDGKTALMHASENGHLNVVSYLLKKKANILMKDAKGNHALKLAAKNGHIEVLNALLKEISITTWPLLDALEIAIREKHTEIANVIANKLEFVSNKALEYAVENNDIEMVKKLIPKVKTLDFPAGYDDRNTVLGIAAKNGFFKIAKALLEAGASVDKHYQYGAAPLFLAAEGGHLKIVNMLLDEYGANPNLYESSSLIEKTPLMIAAEKNHYKIVKALAQKGANLNAYSNGVRKTALMWAVKEKAEESVRELIAAGADLNLIEKVGFGYTALDNAVIGSDIEKMLREAGAKTARQLR